MMEQLEIELKSVCDSHDRIVTRLKSMGAVFKVKREEIDQYFNHPGKDFKETDEALRIRMAGDDTVLTYKGPKIGTRAKSRIEEECLVDDFSAMKAILLNLGFVNSGCVVKERIIYQLGEVEICLDKVESLGTFVELEEIGTDREKIENKLFALAEELGLDTFIRRSYLEMVLEKVGSGKCKD